MYKFLFFISVILIGATQAQAQLLSGCAMDNGNLAHTVSEVDGEIVGRFTFPSYIDYKKDKTGNTLSINAPLSNDGVFSLGLPFINEKRNFVDKVFASSPNLVVVFDSCELQESKDKQLAARFCSKSGRFEINGVELKRLEFSMQNQVRKSLTGSEGQIKFTEVVYADLIFTTVANANGKITMYKSSYSYFPNGDTIQCSLN
jgi:hypothetical protein